MAISAPLYSVKGEKLKAYALPAGIFTVAVNEPLMAQAVRIYLSRQRQNTKKVKTRGEVSYTTQKMWRQKGTGRARHGSRRAPIFVGGGVAHGPTGRENYHLKLSKNMRQAALRSALSLHAQNQTLFLVDGTESLKGKTKAVIQLINRIFPKNQPPAKTLFILDSPQNPLVQSTKNTSQLTSTQALRLNLYEVLNHNLLIFTPKAIEQLTQIL